MTRDELTQLATSQIDDALRRLHCMIGAGVPDSQKELVVDFINRLVDLIEQNRNLDGTNDT
jgi:hypothetical protein